MGVLVSVNLAVERVSPTDAAGLTGIDKRPVAGPVLVRAPGDRQTGLGSGLAGDLVLDRRHHGGDDQAVYAYAREDLDFWGAELGRALPGGVFGENLTTRGVDVTGALIGERWLVGGQVLLEVSVPRIPCGLFAQWMAEPHWVRRFTAAARPGGYLRVVEPGEVRAGDEITVVSRPDHAVTVGFTFQALTTRPELLPHLAAARALPASVLALAERRTDPA